MPVKKKVIDEEEVKSKFSPEHIAVSSYNMSTGLTTKNPWTSVEDIKEDSSSDKQEEYFETVDLCRFFYKTEPVVSTVVNKLIEIGVNDLVFKKKGLPDNQFRIFNALKPKLVEFAEVMAQEFLTSGLVVPEISYGKMDKEELIGFGVKKYQSLTVPTSMFVRDPKTIKINTSLLSDAPSYYVLIPDDIKVFIESGGTFADGHEDKVLYDNLSTYFPEFVSDVKAGKTEIQIEPDMSRLVIRRRFTPENPYPIPYISPVLDALQHKRELRRMDYSIIDKILGAILHVSVGSDEFPVTESDEDQEMMNELRNQLMYRFNTNRALERIFQLLTNHTVKLEWVFPNYEILLNEAKYKDINQEILFGLGFPQILITGESTRSGSSDPEIAMISPVKTMENFRRKIIKVIREVCAKVSDLNGFSTVPDVDFASLNLHAFATFIQALQQAYSVSAISRTSFAAALGHDFDTELAELVDEKKAIDESGLPPVGPSPFSGNVANPQNNQNNTNTQDNNQQNPAPKPTTKAKPSNNAQ